MGQDPHAAKGNTKKPRPSKYCNTAVTCFFQHVHSYSKHSGSHHMHSLLSSSTLLALCCSLEVTTTQDDFHSLYKAKINDAEHGGGEGPQYQTW
jgi:hypothetical protein